MVFKNIHLLYNFYMDTLIKTSVGEITLRPARVTDTPAFRDLRLEALHDHPEAFSSDYAANLAFPLTYWEQRINDLGQAGAIFFADFEGNLVAMCGIHRESSPKLQHTATIWGVYVKEDFRGNHIIERLISCCTAWALEKGIKIVKLVVVTTNTRAIKAYTRFGFTVYGVEPLAACVDGTMYDELLMALRL
jgi:RimJ/RimL family protein N-acetyltransferase